MKVPRRGMALFGLCWLLASCSGAPRLPDGFDPQTVTILVVDPERRPVADAEVLAPTGRARTDARGLAQVPWSMAEEMRDEDLEGRELQVVAAGFTVAVVTWRGCTRTVVLQRDEPIRVVVLEEGSERPLAGVRVCRSGCPQLTVVTGADGAVVVPGVEPLGGHPPNLMLQAWGFEQQVAMERRGGAFVVRLRREPLVDVVLRAAPGRTLVPQVEVEWWGEPFAVPDVNVADEGRELHCRIPAGFGGIRTPGHCVVDEANVPDGVETGRPFAVQLRAATTWSGRVIGPAGPVGGARVFLSWPGGEAMTATRADGTWTTAAGPRDEVCRVWVQAPGHELGKRDFWPDAAEAGEDPFAVAVPDFQLAAEQIVVARLHPSWRGRARPLWVWGYAQGQSYRGCMVWSWPDGRVVLRGLGRGAFELGSPESCSRSFELDGGSALLDLGELPGEAPPPSPRGRGRG